MVTLTAFQGQPTQTDVSQQRVYVKYQQVGIKEALNQLFEKVGAFYTIDTDVQGVVTTDLRDVPSEWHFKTCCARWTPRIVSAVESMRSSAAT